MISRQQKWRNDKAEAGLCIQCGGEKEDRLDKRLCAVCAKKQTAANKKTVAKKVIDSDDSKA